MDFNSVILNDIEKRFGADVSERFKEKSLLRSMKTFFQTTDNFEKSMHQVELPQSGVGKEPMQDKRVLELYSRITESISNDKPVLFVVSGYDEQRAAKVLLERFKGVVSNNKFVIKRLKKTSKGDFVSAITEFTNEQKINNGEPFEVICVGGGSRKDMVVDSAISYMKADGARMSFIGKIDKPAKNDFSILDGSANLSATQLLVYALNAVVSAIPEDKISSLGDKVVFGKHARSLARLANQMSKEQIPLEYRPATSSELAVAIELQKSFSFAGSLDWMLQSRTPYGLTDGTTESLAKALEEHGVDKYELFESVDDIRAANVTAGLMLRQVEQMMPYGYESGNLHLFSETISDQLENLDTNSVEYKKLVNENNILKLRDVITDFKTRDTLSKCQVNALSRMSELIMEAKLANINIKNTLRGSTLLRTRNDGCVKITEVEDALYNVVSPEYLTGLTGQFVDGVSLMVSGSSDKVTNIYARGDADVLESVRNKLDKSEVSNVSGGIYSITKGADSKSDGFNEKELAGVVSHYRACAEKKTKEKHANKDIPVIVVEPATLGTALSMMNYLKVGHSNGIDPDIHFRIPVKERLRVTDSFGYQQFLTLKEIADKDFSFETVECVYQSSDGNDRSIYLDKNDLSTMYKDVGKKRFYGMLKTKFNPNAKDGNLAIIGYDPNYAIKYSRDVVLKSKLKKLSADDSYWRLQNKNGNVTFYNNEKNIVDVNGVSLTSKDSLKALKDVVLGSVDRMSDGVDANGDYAVWCFDTETTGLYDSDHLVNIGASAYSVVKGSGEVVPASSIYRTITGSMFVASHFESVSATELVNIDSSRIIESNVGVEMLSQDGFVNVLPKTALAVENMSKINGKNEVLINRKIKQKYVSALIKDYAGDGLNDVAMNISGISNEQIDKYGLSMPQICDLMERESGEFKQNCFIAHNSDFDTTVIANHSIRLSSLLTKNGNFVADTLRVSKANDTLVASKDVLTINYGSRTVKINANKKNDVTDFLLNGQLGDSIDCEVGKLEFTESRGKVKLRVFDNKGGIFHKDFDVDNRDPKFIEKMFEEKTVHTYPSIKLSSYSYLTFENDSILKNFLSSGSDGDKLRGVNGYLEIYDGAVYAYPKGLEINPKRVGAVGDEAQSLVVQRDVSGLGNNMERFIAVNKATALISTIPTKIMSNDRLLRLAHNDTSKYSLLQSYQALYDFSKTSSQNIKNFFAANKEESLDQLPELKTLDTELRNNNKAKIGCLKQSDMFIAAAKACDNMPKISNECLHRTGKKIGIPKRMMEVAAKCVVLTKKQHKIRGRVFDEQSHCNAARLNSDACVELPVLASVISKYSRNTHLKVDRDNFLVDEISKAAIPATHHAVAARAERKVITRANEQTVGFRNVGGALGRLGLIGLPIVEKISYSAEKGNVGVLVNKYNKFGFTVRDASRFRGFSRKILSFVKNGGVKNGVGVNRLSEIKLLLVEKMESIGVHSMSFIEDVDKNMNQIKTNILDFITTKGASNLDLEHNNYDGRTNSELTDIYMDHVESARSASSLMDKSKKDSVSNLLDDIEGSVINTLVVVDKDLNAVEVIDGKLTADFIAPKMDARDKAIIAKLSAQAAMAECGDNWVVGRNVSLPTVKNNGLKKIIGA